MRSAWPVYEVVGMETIGFGTGAAGDAARVIGATDSVEEIDNDERLDVKVDELELEPESEICDGPVVIPVKLPVSTPV